MSLIFSNFYQLREVTMTVEDCFPNDSAQKKIRMTSFSSNNKFLIKEIVIQIAFVIRVEYISSDNFLLCDWRRINLFKALISTQEMYENFSGIKLITETFESAITDSKNEDQKKKKLNFRTKYGHHQCKVLSAKKIWKKLENKNSKKSVPSHPKTAD